jgi:WD40 repeat protein
MSEYELSSPPSDTISNVTFTPNSEFLLVSSWDETVRLYSLSANVIKCKYVHSQAVLDCVCAVSNFIGLRAFPNANFRYSFQNDMKCYSGGLDRTLKGFEFATSVGESCFSLARWLATVRGYFRDAVFQTCVVSHPIYYEIGRGRLLVIWSLPATLTPIMLTYYSESVEPALTNFLSLYVCSFESSIVRENKIG